MLIYWIYKSNSNIAWLIPDSTKGNVHEFLSFGPRYVGGSPDLGSKMSPRIRPRSRTVTNFWELKRIILITGRLRRRAQWAPWICNELGRIYRLSGPVTISTGAHFSVTLRFYTYRRLIWDSVFAFFSSPLSAVCIATCNLIPGKELRSLCRSEHGRRVILRWHRDFNKRSKFTLFRSQSWSCARYSRVIPFRGIANMYILIVSIDAFWWNIL